jgi:hypothetical protein
MRTVLVIVGGLMVLLGLLWAAQGSGIFPYPAQSFMISQRPWVWRGLGVAAAGAVLLALSRRRPR